MEPRQDYASPSTSPAQDDIYLDSLRLGVSSQSVSIPQATLKTSSSWSEGTSNQIGQRIPTLTLFGPRRTTFFQQVPQSISPFTHPKSHTTICKLGPASPNKQKKLFQKAIGNVAEYRFWKFVRSQEPRLPRNKMRKLPPVASHRTSKTLNGKSKRTRTHHSILTLNNQANMELRREKPKTTPPSTWMISPGFPPRS
ncbi:hypothetical protein CERZMDRAFT_101744 [Cercospora zeae-maydis SCOH1-5]|uniref:Uncharacterized protein n=1 Tax=Cercospora zeae-maydis SCOH1-5 TaxID=717836 RepID=A0A6A6F6T0_9PEZI|nr:hypothetical protein CERZMDRAFT_101744 [Cercospora zeae-maydis SCOH1-5]